MEKCAVWAASPISTTGAWPLWCTQRAQTTRGKRIHCAEPRRWLALEIRGWPSSCLANNCSQKAIASSFSIVSSPAARHTSSGASTMKVEVVLSKR
ncbi:hypothetical protein D3C78_1617110 [compost metagenome]